MEIYSKERIESIYDKLVDGIKKYTSEHGFKKAVIGLSGGIDSAVTCALAARALGIDNVLGIVMPSKYSSAESEEYARCLAKNLGIELRTVSICDTYDSYLKMLESDLGGNETEEIEIYHQNIQARIRGNILMAFSNRFGHLVLATGNRSEAMMGYCTLYGDTVGGLAVISDVFKAGVYGLAEYINRGEEIIPVSIIDRVPSAELKPGQADHHSLPQYDILDEVLYRHLDKGCSQKEIEEKGFDPEVIKNIIATIKKMEYKRMQCPPGIKIDKQ